MALEPAVPAFNFVNRLRLTDSDGTSASTLASIWAARSYVTGIILKSTAAADHLVEFQVGASPGGAVFPLVKVPINAGNGTIAAVDALPLILPAAVGGLPLFNSESLYMRVVAALDTGETIDAIAIVAEY